MSAAAGQPSDGQDDKDKSLLKEGDEAPQRPLDIERLRRCIIEFVKERGVLLMELVTIVHEASLQWRQEYERVVDAILYYAHAAGVLSIKLILLKILDPDLNVIPPIFTLTELSRGILKRAYMFPGLLRQVTHGRTQWDEILSVLISETMAEEGLPPPSECLANQIEFVRSNTGPPDEAMQAVLDNAFRHESPVSRNVHAIFQQRLDGQPTDEPHLLPYGRAANNKLDAFDMQQIATNYGLYSAMEHTLMRQWAWNLLPDTISLAHLFVDNAFGNTLLNLNSWLVYNPMDNARAGRLVVCPEIVRMLLITMMRAMKIMDVLFILLQIFFELMRLGIESDPELMRINQVYTWAPSQLSSLPLTAQRTAITLEEDTAKAETFQREVHTDFMQMRGQPEMSWMEYMSMPSRQPTILCVIFRYLIESPPEHQILSPVIYQEYVLAVNALTDYIISQCSAEKNSEEFLPMALLNCSEINERIDFYCRFIPRRDVDAPEHFRRLTEYHRKFPEMTFAEMANRPPMMAEMINPRAHYPIYYGSLIERLLPILDFTLARALELQVDNIFSTILTTCGPIYKFHRDQSSLTQSFINDNHQRVYSFEELVYELADRIITCSEFILTPPSYVAPDWRFAEYPPAAQALYLACIELLASPHSPESLKVVSVLYTKIGDITERYGDILHGDELCDLLYYFKYMFVGDFLRKEAEAAFPRFPPRMRERLKFYTSFSSNKEKDEDHCHSKMSAVNRPDLAKILKSRSNAAERSTEASVSGADH
ncbi:hypothetical protein TELCIR_03087 [Teladorsagia circumcincta]|uniref:Mediator of RNA polymerase II transcription subunit 23 n=1 Tax=Teladorsagia circumcincta TaxID=45464 RepID=A0A2G9UXB1_TELCI|nr:hypothetical protein TELCIR_03087 [Teladorsagia circumcincta]